MQPWNTEKYGNIVFGKISNIQLSGIFIRNGKSDKLSVGPGQLAAII